MFVIMYLKYFKYFGGNEMKYALIALIAYLFGSFCASIPLSKKFCGSDVRTHGSGNAGATNVARVFGMKAGLITLLCDMAKTLISAAIGNALCGVYGMALAGTMCIIGHCFPIYFGFKGGKGVSVGAALGLICGWKVFLFIMAVFFLVAVLSRKVSLGSMCAALALPISALLFDCHNALIFMCVFSALLVVFMHRGNIKRLINGTEPDFSPKKKKD